MAAPNPKNWNATTPAAPSQAVNVHYQADTPDATNPNTVRDASSYVNEASSTEAGVVPNLTGHSGKVVAVKSDETGLEFVSPSGGGGGAFNGVNIQTGTSYTYLNADKGKLVHHSNAAPIAATLHGAEPYDANWYLWVENGGVGILTITPDSGTIEGISTLVLLTGEGAFIAWDGTNYYAERGVGPSNVELQANKDQNSGYAGLDSSALLKPAEFPTPTTSTFGGVKDVAAVTNKVVNAITNGVAQLVQIALSWLSDVLITSPADGDVFSYEASSSKWKNKAPSALGGLNANSIRGQNVTSTTPLKGQTFIFDGTNWIPHFQQQLNHYWMASSGASGATDASCCHFLKAASQTNAPSFAAASASEPGTFQYSTGTGANVSSNLGESTAQGVTRDILRTWRCKLKLSQTANVRVWMGLFSTVSSNMRTDTPGALYAAFRYSTAAGDSKWQCVTATDATHQTVTAESTSSHVDATTYHTFEIQFDGTNFVFFIDGTQVGSQATNLPTSGTGLGTVINIDNVNLANDRLMKLVYFGYSETATDGSDGNV